MLDNIYFQMSKIRIFEETLSNYYKFQNMRSPIHLSIGQELSPSIFSQLITSKDKVFSTHRNHAHYLAFGGIINDMLLELYSKSGGPTDGRGGSMHLFHKNKNLMLSSPIVGSSIPIGVGYALSEKISNTDSISIVYMGEAATEEGVFHESVNLSSIFEIPVLFICENNFFSVYTYIEDRQKKIDRNYENFYGIKEFKIKTGNIMTNLSVSKKAFEYVKKSKKPAILNLNTYRFIEHCGPSQDDHLNYRNKNELQFWRKQDPLINIKKYIDKSNLKKIDKKIDRFHKKIIKNFEKFEKTNTNIINKFKKIDIYAK
tara:strand:+ start:844 stop:1788 length:945 start_codon:yes stop_codon:yes gene_type:complete